MASEIELQERARRMRREPTEAEKRLWRYLSNSQLGGHKFRRQAVIGNAIVDFLCPARALVIEVDGDTHEAARDERRDAQLLELGFQTLRVTNEDVLTSMEGVLTAIEIALRHSRERWPQPHPNPSPEGEGLSRSP